MYGRRSDNPCRHVLLPLMLQLHDLEGSPRIRLRARWREVFSTAQQAARFWTGSDASLIIASASSGDWQKLRDRMPALGSALRKNAFRIHPQLYFKAMLDAWWARADAVLRPRGLCVVLLGPDGAGKSSGIEALTQLLAPAFPRNEIRGFAPPLGRLLGRRPAGTSEPHGLPRRSRAASLIRAAYWLAFYLTGHIGLRIARARSTLVLYDRHFADILVDAKRYRYGGPDAILRFIWRVMPKPDLVILLDAPAEVLQARKQEVSFAETARQREGYLAFVSGLKTGRVLDAAAPSEKVAGDAAALILARQAGRENRSSSGKFAASDSNSVPVLDAPFQR